MLTKLINNKRSFSPNIDYSNIPLLSLIKDSLTEMSFSLSEKELIGVFDIELWTKDNMSIILKSFQDSVFFLDTNNEFCLEIIHLSNHIYDLNFHVIEDNRIMRTLDKETNKPIDLVFENIFNFLRADYKDSDFCLQ
jgi:hypothetical protein